MPETKTARLLLVIVASALLASCAAERVEFKPDNTTCSVQCEGVAP